MKKSGVEKVMHRGKWKGVLLAALVGMMTLGSFETVYATDSNRLPYGTEKAEDTVIQPTQTPEKKSGLYKEGKAYHYYYKGKLQKNCWKTINGRKYYFKADGNAVTTGHYQIKGQYYVFNKYGQKLAPKNNALMSVGTYKYYVNPQGKPLPGWRVIQNKVYYVYESGKCAANKTVDAIKFDSNGCAVNTTKAKCKIAAAQFIAQHTTPGQSKAEKFRTCFNYIMAYTNFQPWNDPTPQQFQTKDWPYEKALEMFQTSLSGSCYGIGSCVAAVAKELGYNPYVIAITADHCFVMIDGKYYDNMGPLFGATSHFDYEIAHKVKF